MAPPWNEPYMMHIGNDDPLHPDYVEEPKYTECRDCMEVKVDEDGYCWGCYDFVNE